MIDAGDVQSDALGTVAGWLPGYTHPADGESQHKITLLDSIGADSVVVEYAPADRYGPDPDRGQTFRITVSVEEVT